MSQALLDFCQSQQPAMVAAVRELVGMESPSTSKADCDRLGARLAERLRQAGAPVLMHPQPEYGDYLEAAWPSGEPPDAQPLLVLCHFDTVWALGTLAQTPLSEDDGRLAGPGAFDMKGGIVTLEFALRAIANLGLTPRRPIVLLFTSDEEVGSPTSRPLIEARAGGAAAALVLESPLANGALKTARKGVGRYLVRVHGRAAHAGLEPEKGVNAIGEIARLIPQVEALADPAQGTTLNVGVIRGGTRGNVVPALAEMEIDLRVWTAAEAQRVGAGLAALLPRHAEARLEVEGGLNRPPMERTEATAALFERARQIARDLGQELGEGSAGGGSDGNFTAALGVPTLDGLGPLGNGAHAAGEYILVDSLPGRAALLASLLLHL